MRERFEGDDGRRRLVESLRAQTIVEGNEAVAQEIAAATTLEEYMAGAELVRQSATDNHVFFILSGKVHIVVNGRKVNTRAAGQHVGEMSLIDPKARRSASVVAAEPAVVAKVSEPDFARLAETYPRLWRLIALELADA